MGTREYLLEKAKNEGIEDERAKAKAEILAIAREMKKDGISIEQIVKFTKLPMETVKKLK